MRFALEISAGALWLSLGCEGGLKQPSVVDVPPASPVIPSADAGASDSAIESMQDAAIPIDPEKRVGRLRKGFRACYDAGLKRDPKMEGSVMIRVHVSEDGRVASTEASHVEGLSSEVVACLTHLVERARFDPPNGEVGTEINVPLRFVPQVIVDASAP